MFNAKVIGVGPDNTALLGDFAKQLQNLVMACDLTQADCYVVAFGSPNNRLGKYEPSSVGIIAGGSLERMKALYHEIGVTIAKGEREARAQGFDDYYRPEPEPEKSPFDRLRELLQRPDDGGPLLRCDDYPNCACGPAVGTGF